MSNFLIFQSKNQKLITRVNPQRTKCIKSNIKRHHTERYKGGGGIEDVLSESRKWKNFVFLVFRLDGMTEIGQL